MDDDDAADAGPSRRDTQLVPTSRVLGRRQRSGDPPPSDKFLKLQGDAIIERARQRAEDLQECDLWTQSKAFYLLAEQKWKELDTEYINHPGHACERDQCTLRNEKVVVYRDSDGATHDLVNVMMGEGLSTKNMHVCFPRYCEHIGAHRCKDRAACPHRRPARAEDTKELKYVWICVDTGTIHVCGPYCQKKSILTDREGHLVCPLTGAVVDTTFGQQFPANSARLPGASMNMLTSREYEMRVKKRISRGPKILLPWQREEDMLQYRALTSILLDTLLFSEQRQRLEVNRIVDTCNKAYNETARSLRPKKGRDDKTADPPWMEYAHHPYAHAHALALAHTHIPQHGAPPISVSYAMSVLSTYYPVSRYFHIVPPRPTLLPVIKKAIEATPILRQHAPLAHEEAPTPGRECAHCRREKCHARLRELLHDLSGGAPPEDPVQWESHKWQAFVNSTKKMITDVALRIWINLNKHTYDPAKGRENMPYTKIVLAIVYLMKSEYSIPVQTLIKDKTNILSVPRVVVIPKLSVASLLPSDIVLPKLELPKTCKALVRTLNNTQSSIKEQFSDLVRRGHGYDIQINLGMASLAQAAREG